MNPGRMRDKISIWARGDKQQKSGYYTQERQLICTIRARRADATTREVWEAFAAKTRNVVNFYIRPMQGIKPGMWVECNEQWHEIIGIQHGSYLTAPMVLKTICKELI